MIPSSRIVCIVTLLLVCCDCFAQQFYIIVGAFAQESNAQKFTGYVRSLRYSAQYELNTDKNYFYVYTLRGTNREDALTQVKALQKESEFKDAWVFAGQLGNPVTPTAVEPSPAKEEEKIEAQPAAVAPDTAAIAVASLPPVVAAVAEPEMKVKGKLFKFQLMTIDGQPVHGEVHNVDYQRGREIAAYKSDEYIDMLAPSSSNNPMSIVCGIFGYKEVVKLVDYNNPDVEQGVVKDARGAWIIPYRLERLKKGDVSVMYHVSFYKDAVVMLPRSKEELDELVTMMKDNPNYKIKIHGHCNGTYSRRIIALGPGKNYFNVSGSDERNGSAKELSKLRAEAVKSYLSDNEIAAERSEIYAWGALNMLVSETSTSAKLNDRIEIEILQD